VSLPGAGQVSGTPVLAAMGSGVAVPERGHPRGGGAVDESSLANTSALHSGIIKLLVK
jgi:hypothetical protein